MSKKKRNKKYKGSNASAPTTIVKVSAVKRHPVHQWWLDKKRILKPALIIAAILTVFILVIIGIVGIIF